LQGRELVTGIRKPVKSAFVLEVKASDNGAMNVSNEIVVIYLLRAISTALLPGVIISPSSGREAQVSMHR
jgi:hypothetical protein